MDQYMTDTTPVTRANATRWLIEEQSRKFELWVSEERDYVLLEYQPYDDGDAENGPHLAYEPVMVQCGLGVPFSPRDEEQTRMAIIDVVKHFIATEELEVEP